MQGIPRIIIIIIIISTKLRNYKQQPYLALHTQTAGSADVKAQNNFHGKNNITCSTHCK